MRSYAKPLHLLVASPAFAAVPETRHQILPLNGERAIRS
jgi:hypothetical protein